MLLTSHIRGHLLSLEFHPQMVTRIQHLQTPIISFMAQKMHFQREKTIQMVIKSACAQKIKEVHARALDENAGKVHVADARLCMQISMHT
jgi:hypothetical protein